MKYSFFSIFFLICWVSSEGQSSQSGVNLNPVIPPSPRSREFEKYIDYKVSLYNGLAETNINFYTIDLDGIKMPISISYHASGIKHGQTSGDVGIGWSLDPGYRISRNIYGRADEYYTMPSMANIISDLNNNYSTPFDRDYYLSRFMVSKPTSEIPAVSALQGDYLDGQFDMFTLGLPDQTSKFIIDNRATKSIVTLDNDAVGKISYSTDNDNLINKFDITDNNGIKYKFGDDATAGEGTRIYINDSYRDVKTAWMLREITSPFGRKMNFNYAPNEVNSSGMQIYSREIIEGVRYQQYATVPDGWGTSSTDPAKTGTLSQADTRVYSEKILSSIVTPFESVTINRNSNSTVNTISIAKPNGDVIKKMQFFYTVSTGGKSFLDSVAISDARNVVSEKYRFEYVTKEVTYRNYNSFGYPVDGHTSADCDYPIGYGDFYYRMVTRNTGHEPNAPIYYTEDAVPAHIVFCGIDKRWWETSQNGMLKKIIFPTGGSREFQYESNTFRVVTSASSITGAWGGLRISQIRSFSDTGVPILTKTYSYPNGAVSMFDPYDKNLYMQRKKILVSFFDTYPHVWSIDKTTQTSVLDNELSEALNQSNNGWYDLVVENDGLGKTEYKYQVPFQDAGVSNFPTNQTSPANPFQQQYLTSYNFWNRPQLKEEIIYKRDVPSATFAPVRKVTYEYTQPNPSPSDKFIGIKVFPYAIGQPGVEQSVGSAQTPPPGNLYTESGINSVFNYGTYTITRGYPTLWRKVVTDYQSPTVPITTFTEYEYKNSRLLRTEKMANSVNDTIINKYVYPSDFLNVTGSDNISNGIKTMIATNTVNPVVEKSMFIKPAGSNVSKLLSSSFYSFKTGIPVPDKLYTMQYSTGIPVFKPAGVQGGSVIIDNRYKERLSFNLYSNTGELLEQQKNRDVKEVFLWGYNHRYPVARISNTSYDVAITYINQSILDNATGAGDDAMLRSHLSNLRNIPGTLVSIYTYKPLVGMTSETDPSGKTSYYEYDEVGRLRVIKDEMGNIIKRVCYNYAGEPQNCAVTYYNNARSATFTKQCSSGTGSEVIYLVPEGKHTSTISQEDADQKAQNDIAANGQNWANANGTCPAPFCGFGNAQSGFNPGPTNMSNNGTTVSGYFVFYPTQSINPDTDYLIVMINSGCAPGNTQTIDKTIDGRSWTFTILTDGRVYGRFAGASINAQSQVYVSNFSYSL